MPDLGEVCYDEFCNLMNILGCGADRKYIYQITTLCSCPQCDCAERIAMASADYIWAQSEASYKRVMKGVTR